MPCGGSPAIDNVGGMLLRTSMSVSLKAFVLRGEVLHLYRHFLKTVRRAPAAARGARKSPCLQINTFLLLKR